MTRSPYNLAYGHREQERCCMFLDIRRHTSTSFSVFWIMAAIQFCVQTSWTSHCCIRSSSRTGRGTTDTAPYIRPSVVNNNQAFSISRGDSSSPSVEPELPPDLPPVSLPQLLAPVDAAFLPGWKFNRKKIGSSFCLKKI